MPRLSKTELLQHFVQAAGQSGWSVSYQDVPPQHPYRLVISRDETSDSALLYIWNITPGGNNRPADEFRIQLTGVKEIKQLPGFKTLVLGYWDANDVFAGWDASKHSGVVSNSPSLQIREEFLLKAHTDNLAVYPKANDEVAVAFSPSFLITYISNLYELHGAVTVQEQAILTQAAEHAGQINDADLQPLPVERQRIVRTIAQNQRATDFRKRVLMAYGHACAVCGVQLELVDAAHIIPVRHPASTDNTNNGLCLCALHHRAFDSGLIAVRPDYKIVVNNEKVARFKASNMSAGAKSFLDSLMTQIRLPVEHGSRPTGQLIDTALRVRELDTADLRTKNDVTL